MGESSALACMVGIVSHGESCYADKGLNGTNMDWVLVKVWVTRAVPVDVFPCLDGVEVKFCGRDSHDWAIFVMEEFILEGNTSFEESSDTGDGTNGVELWARKLCKRIKSKSVN